MPPKADKKGKIAAAATEKGKSAGDRSDLNVDESNALRAKLGIKPLAETEKQEKEGSSKNPVSSQAIAEKEKSSGPSDADVKRGKAAAKNKKEHEELTKGEGLGDILVREEKGSAADWIAKSRNADGTMKNQAVADASKARAAAGDAAGGKKRKADGAAGEMPAMKVRHDKKDIDETVGGHEVTMVLSDKQILNKDGGLNDDKDELSNVRFVDNEKAVHNDAVRNQKEYDPTKEGQDILEKYNDLKTGPKGFMIGGSQTAGALDETDP